LFIAAIFRPGHLDIPVSQMLVQSYSALKISYWLTQATKNLTSPNNVYVDLDTNCILGTVKAFTRFQSILQYNDAVLTHMKLKKGNTKPPTTIKIDCYKFVKTIISQQYSIGEKIWLFYTQNLFQLTSEEHLNTIEEVLELILTVALSDYMGENELQAIKFLTAYSQDSRSIITGFNAELSKGNPIELKIEEHHGESTNMYQRLHDKAAKRCSQNGVDNVYKCEEIINLLRQLIPVVCLWTGMPLKPDKLAEICVRLNQPFKPPICKSDVYDFVTQYHKGLAVFFQTRTQTSEYFLIKVLNV
jgi:hypothetical protein